MPSLSRRALLRTAAAGAVVGLAGCSSSCPDQGTPTPDHVFGAAPTTTVPFDAAPDDDWPAPRFDSGNTGAPPETRPPSDPVGVRWQTELPTPDVSQGRLQPSSPVVADGRVFVAEPQGVHAIRFTDGEHLWRNEVVRPGTMGPTYSYDDERVPPVVGFDGSVFVGGRDAVSAIDPESGGVRWQFTEAGGFGAPTVVGDTVYVGASTPESAVYALDAVEGTPRWSAPAFPDYQPTMPAVADDVVVVSDVGTTLALDTRRGEEAWSASRGAEFYPVVADDTVYVGSYEGLTGYSLSDGTRQWTFDRGSGRTFASPVVTDDAVYTVERPGEAGMATFALDRTDGAPTPRWCSDVAEGAVTAAAGDQAFCLLSGSGVGEEERANLVAFSERFGDALWGMAASPRTYWILPPAVVDRALVTVDPRGTVSAVGRV